MSNESVFKIDAAIAGERLDKIITLLLPDCSLRKSRRLIETGQATLNGKTAGAGFRPTTGNELAIRQTPVAMPVCPPFLLGKQGDYAFYFKPREMHTQAIAASPTASLESWLAGQFPSPPTLLQRLDCNTCGIVCAALREKAAEDFRHWEKAGLCGKFYLCLLKGRLEKPLSAKIALASNGRKKARTLSREAEPERQTIFFPLSAACGANLKCGDTWALAFLKRGARHQIRAHAAALGFPLVNDDLYGSGDGNFNLRHIRLDFPGHSFQYLENCPGGFAGPTEIENGIESIMGKVKEFSRQ